MTMFIQLRGILRDAYQSAKRTIRGFWLRLLNEPGYAEAAVTVVVCGVELLRPYPAVLRPVQQLARTWAALVRLTNQNCHHSNDRPWQLA